MGPASAAIQDKLFHPFVSYGKENGTGLGLTVVQRLCRITGARLPWSALRTLERVSHHAFPDALRETRKGRADEDERTTPFFAGKSASDENSIRHSDT
jgi:hypothetical protein